MSRLEAIDRALEQVRARIAAALTRAQRPPGSVRLVAVSKKMPAADVVAAMASGQVDFGENYAQELRDKRGQTAALAAAAHIQTRPQWHFIGPLQANKAKYVAGQAALVHSLDTADLLAELNRRVPPDHVQDCLVQVNVAAEPQKRGVSVEALPVLLDAISAHPRLRCVGLMVIPPLGPEPESNRNHFRTLRTLLEHHARQTRAGVHLTELSMGMSEDLDVAIEEGATLVRVGTAIFGPRH